MDPDVITVWKSTRGIQDIARIGRKITVRECPLIATVRTLESSYLDVILQISAGYLVREVANI